MEFVRGNMIVNEEDLDFILKKYIQAYRFRNDNKLPKKIIFKSSRDYVELTEAPWEEVQGKKIPYECGGFGDKCRHIGTRRVGRPAKTKRGSKSGTTKPTESE